MRRDALDAWCASGLNSTVMLAKPPMAHWCCNGTQRKPEGNVMLAASNTSV